EPENGIHPDDSPLAGRDVGLVDPLPRTDGTSEQVLDEVLRVLHQVLAAEEGSEHEIEIRPHEKITLPQQAKQIEENHPPYELPDLGGKMDDALAPGEQEEEEERRRERIEQRTSEHREIALSARNCPEPGHVGLCDQEPETVADADARLDTLGSRRQQ